MRLPTWSCSTCGEHKTENKWNRWEEQLHFTYFSPSPKLAQLSAKRHYLGPWPLPWGERGWSMHPKSSAFQGTALRKRSDSFLWQAQLCENRRYITLRLLPQEEEIEAEHTAHRKKLERCAESLAGLVVLIFPCQSQSIGTERHIFFYKCAYMNANLQGTGTIREIWCNKTI